MTWRIGDYRTAAGETPVRSFIDGLTSDAKAEAIALIKLAETHGNKLREPHSKALGRDSSSCAATRSGCSTCSSQTTSSVSSTAS
jgi:hypothetical protein